MRVQPSPRPRGLPRGIHPVHSGRFHSAERVTARHSRRGGEGVSTEHFPNNAVLLRYEIIPASSLTFAHAKLLEHQRRDASHIIRHSIANSSSLAEYYLYRIIIKIEIHFATGRKIERCSFVHG